MNLNPPPNPDHRFPFQTLLSPRRISRRIGPYHMLREHPVALQGLELNGRIDKFLNQPRFIWKSGAPSLPQIVLFPLKDRLDPKLPLTETTKFPRLHPFP
jgi:hypothetical protein